MKKSNYVNYLKEFEAKGALMTSKTFKNSNKPPRMYRSKSLKPNIKDQKLVSKNVDILNSQREENKQNHHPNICYENDKIFIPKQIIKKEIQFEVNLRRCNFEPSHQNKNLFLIEGQNNGGLIVCQQCSLKFSKRIPLKSFEKKTKYTYAKMIYTLEELQKENRKLNKIKLIEKENIIQTLQKIQGYYNHIAHVILQTQDELKHSLQQVYNQNEFMMNAIIEKNKFKIDKLNQAIEQKEKQCLLKTSHHDNLSNFEEQIDFIFDSSSQKNQQIQLSCIDVQIPMDILKNFLHDFKSSKYFIEFSKFSLKQDYERYSQIESQQIKQTEQSLSKLPQQDFAHKNKKMLSPDFEKQIPFNVEYSVTEEKPADFSHRMEDELSQSSSSEQLLIDSLRNHKLYPDDVKSLNHLSQKLGMNFKTLSSTHRTCPSKEECNYGRQNFVKHLHIDDNEVADLICNEDLTLSSSHPIHSDQQNLLPKKSLRLSYNPMKGNQPLTVSQLSPQSNQKQKMTEILNRSLISKNENKHEISFELDENMIIDANILPSEELDQENFDIISPAFKII